MFSGERDREFGMGMHTLLHLRWIANKDLRYSTWNSAQGCVEAWMGGGFWGRTIACICVAEFIHSSPETLTTL